MEFLATSLVVATYDFVGDILLNIGWFLVVGVIGGVMWMADTIKTFFKNKEKK